MNGDIKLKLRKIILTKLINLDIKNAEHEYIPTSLLNNDISYSKVYNALYDRLNETSLVINQRKPLMS